MYRAVLDDTAAEADTQNYKRCDFFDVLLLGYHYFVCLLCSSVARRGLHYGAQGRGDWISR